MYRGLNAEWERKMIKQDCFGYKRGTCMVLTELVCGQRECSFYKTQEQFRQDAEKYGEVAGQCKEREVITVTYNGKTQSLAQWSQETGINQATLWLRITRLKWDVERALTTPVKRYKR